MTPVFLPFFYTLRSEGVPVSPTEWLALLDALGKGLHRESLDGFYHLARSLLVKDVAHYDAFDQAFARCFQGASAPGGPEVRDEILEWLADPLSRLVLTPEELARLRSLSLEELLRELEERLRTQDGPHHGGHHWIGTGGTSPFGQRGSHPTGVSFADQEEGRGGAVLQARGRRYRNLRNDIALDIRQIGLALKRLRDLRRTGAEVLDLEATIDKTCRDGGEIDLVFSRERENQVRLVLAIDTGGSMEPHRVLCEQLFSAARGLRYFKDFRHFYFHNCIYENLYTDLDGEKFTPTAEVIRQCEGTHRLVVVGDAAMAPFELLAPNGFLERYRTSSRKGIDWLKALREAFPKRVWLNPTGEDSWGQNKTVDAIGRIFPMFPLTLNGLERAVKTLV